MDFLDPVVAEKLQPCVAVSVDYPLTMVKSWLWANLLTLLGIMFPVLKLVTCLRYYTTLIHVYSSGPL